MHGVIALLAGDISAGRSNNGATSISSMPGENSIGNKVKLTVFNQLVRGWGWCTAGWWMRPNRSANV